MNGEARELKSATLSSAAAPEKLDGSDPKAKPDNWADKPESKAYQAAEKAYRQVADSFKNKDEQSDRIEEYWCIYNAQPDANQMYMGNSPGYIPATRDAINARAKRCLKQLFPVNHKHVEGLSADGNSPDTQLSLLEHYIRKTTLKSIIRSDLIAGDTTGQWGLAIDWTSSKRSITKVVRRNPIVEQIDGETVEDLGIEDTAGEDAEETEQEEITEEGPDIVDFAVEDLSVVPPTCNDLQKAKIVTLRVRYSKEKLEELVDEGAFVLPDGTEVSDFLEKTNKALEKRDRAKKQTEDAGVKTNGTYKHCVVFMSYMKLDFEEDGVDYKQPAVVYYAGEKEILGIIKNPLWSGRTPILSQPVDRVRGSFFGKSKIEPVKFTQWQLCDFWNMGQDAAMYSLLPVWAVDPLKVPNWTNLVMGLAAIWPIAPADVKSITSPQLWKDSGQICDMMKRQIWESLDVNEMMMGKMPAGRKNNQLMGQMAQEQATSISDHAERYEEVMLNPLLEFLFEFDQQFRTESVTIEKRGEIGVKAAMEEIPPQQWGERYFFRWSGTSYQMTMQRMQAMTGWVNVLKGVPPQMMPGKKLDLTPFLVMGTEHIFGPEIGPKILIDTRNMFIIDPDTENQILHNGMPVEVHEADNDQEHLQSHMRAAALAGDEQMFFKNHMGAHMFSMKAKREKEMGAQAGQKGQPGMPGAGPPGAAGAPRPGAQPAPQRPAQQPPGAIQQDNMAGAPGRG